MTRPVLPTPLLLPRDVPAPDAPFDEIASFALLDDRYDSLFESGRAAEIGNGWEAVGLGVPSLADLRTALLFEQRRLHHTSWGGTITHPDGTQETFIPDPEIEERPMRRLVREIGRRVASGAGPALSVWRGDITTLAVDVVVNAANPSLLGGGGVDGAIHRAAGPELRRACEQIPSVRGERCPTGEARVTAGFGLPAAHVVHTVGPRWRGGEAGEDEALASAYRSSLSLAAEVGAETVAFPAISTGVYGFPAERAARIAVGAVRTWLDAHRAPHRVALVAFSEADAATLRAAL